MATIPEPVGVSAHTSTHPPVPGDEPGAPESPNDEKSIDIPSGATSDTASEEIYIDRKAERALVWRLDLVFLFAGFLGYIFKYLDQTNIVSVNAVGESATLMAEQCLCQWDEGGSLAVRQRAQPVHDVLQVSKAIRQLLSRVRPLPAAPDTSSCCSPPV